MQSNHTGYFPQFVPKEVATTQSQQTWYGNLKKYHAVLWLLYGDRSGSYPGTITGSNPVMQDNEIKNVPDLWKNFRYMYQLQVKLLLRRRGTN